MNETINKELDLILERIVDVPPESIWKAWTTPNHLKEWFCPKPWGVTECHIDLRRGGSFKTTMVGPNGEKHDNIGCYLEIIENQRLVWTDALEADYRPATTASSCFDGRVTCFLILEPHGGKGTKYTAIAKHGSIKDREAHEALGFEMGWGIVLMQLVEYIKVYNL